MLNNNKVLQLIFDSPGCYLFQAIEISVADTSLPDEDREREPPDRIPNSEVKPFIADGSVGSPHVRVGHRQALY